MKLLVLLGSNRPESYNARLVDLAVRDLPARVEVRRFDLATLPFYDEQADAEGRMGPVVEAFRAEVAAADAIVFASPAYNGTLSAMAKNAIDVASRPRGMAPLTDKPVLLLSAVYTPGAEARVLDHARLAFTIAGARPLGRDFGVNQHFQAFDATGLVDKERERELRGLVSQLLVPAAAA